MAAALRNSFGHPFVPTRIPDRTVRAVTANLRCWRVPARIVAGLRSVPLNRKFHFQASRASEADRSLRISAPFDSARNRTPGAAARPPHAPALHPDLAASLQNSVLKSPSQFPKASATEPIPSTALQSPWP